MAETRNVTIERVFDAPVEKVWAAWTDPAEVSKWWGPKGFTSPDNKVDLRVGGQYVFAMRGPEGSEWDSVMYSGGQYKEVEPMKRLVYTDNFTDKDGNKVSPEVYGMPADFPQDLLVTMTFEEVDGKTKLTLTHQGLPAGEVGEQTEAGWNESLDKLADSLNK
jgi:uncharacterized protein YndB with AHSA1/START domain